MTERHPTYRGPTGSFVYPNPDMGVLVICRGSREPRPRPRAMAPHIGPSSVCASNDGPRVASPRGSEAFYGLPSLVDGCCELFHGAVALLHG